MLVAFSGKIQSGKNTAANLFAKNIRYRYSIVQHRYFAFKLKQVVEILTGIKMKQSFTDNFFSNGITDFTTEDKSIFIPEFDMSVGQMLQVVGTDVFRDHFHKETWIRSLFLDYDSYERNNTCWVITDCRFTNEAEYIKNNGGILIRVNRPDLEQLDESGRDRSHPSEIALDLYDGFDYIINNEGGLDDLEKKIVDIIKQI